MLAALIFSFHKAGKTRCSRALSFLIAAGNLIDIGSNKGIYVINNKDPNVNNIKRCTNL